VSGSNTGKCWKGVQILGEIPLGEFLNEFHPVFVLCQDLCVAIALAPSTSPMCRGPQRDNIRTGSLSDTRKTFQKPCNVKYGS
jgi:hypothetical protein